MRSLYMYLKTIADKYTRNIDCTVIATNGMFDFCERI